MPARRKTRLPENLWFGSVGVSLAITTILAIAAAVAYGVWPQGDRGASDAETRLRVARGQEVYAEACASCHGENLEGQPNWRIRMANGRLPAPPHDETGHTWHHPDEMLFGMTKLGVQAFLGLEGYESDMPKFEGVLSDEEIWAVLAYIKSTWPPKVRARQEDISRRNQQNRD